LVDKEIKALSFSPKEALTQENLQRVFEKFNFSNEDDMYAAVGYQGITAAMIATRLTDKLRKEQQKELELSQTLDEAKSEVNEKDARYMHDSVVKIEGVDNLLVRLAKFCNPVP